ncbi:MAG: MBL fold metallo-hydrolase [Candidatus Magasanikbacteria bacterium]|nr:MBL fold metallo-hydrolase [Candidatus Magasanikbacteria bacterium]
MKITFYGTRGSTPVSGPNSVRHGGNTTCLRIESACLPQGHWLVVDAGSGIVPLSWEFMKAQGKAVTVLQSHFHHDHTQGLMLSVFPYVKQIPVNVFGPYEHGIGSRQVYERLMQSPFFPIDFREIGSHITCHDIELPNCTVLLIHPEGGIKKLTLEEFERLVASGRQMPFHGRQKFDVSECLVVRMHRSHHPEQTISYRFEERPTGKVFAFVTDHENQDGIPMSFRAHLQGADLLVMDCQYTDEKYRALTAGWGHSTPSYVTRVAREVKAARLGLTHHDPSSSDDMVDGIVASAAKSMEGTSVEVFGCHDFQVVEV